MTRLRSDCFLTGPNIPEMLNGYLLFEVEQYIREFSDEANKARSSKHMVLLHIEEVIEFYKTEFEHLDPRLWKTGGLKALRDVQKMKSLIHKMELLKMKRKIC